jgi:hypothetical protein
VPSVRPFRRRSRQRPITSESGKIAETWLSLFDQKPSSVEKIVQSVILARGSNEMTDRRMTDDKLSRLSPFNAWGGVIYLLNPIAPDDEARSPGSSVICHLIRASGENEGLSQFPARRQSFSTALSQRSM